jgi:hypothetical protein
MLALTFLLAAAASSARAQEEGSLGAGVVAGNPTGVTAKYWLNGLQAIDLGVGFSGDPAFYADFLWHAWDMIAQPKQGHLGVYAGLGPRIEAKSQAQFGVRTIAGLSYWLPRHPIELFLDGGPVFVLTPDWTVNADIGLGVRFYFGPSKG